MKIRHSTSSGKDKIELQMTPMIDIVFQLLVFFIMTFRIVSQEGDFNIKMPLANPQAGLPDPSQTPPMVVRLTADGDGQLTSITMNGTTYKTFRELHLNIVETIGHERGPGSRQETAEVELDCDYELDYRYVVEAITAVSGYRDKNGHIVKLVEKIKFAPPKKAPDAS